MKKQASLLLAVLLMISGIGYSQSQVEFRAMDPMGRNIVQFKTSAPLEDIVGTTNKISGKIIVDPNNLESSDISAMIEVDMASLQTGIGLRDRHMRDQYLHTERYPSAVFKLSRIGKNSSSKLKPNQPVSMVLEGTFDLHGVQCKIKVPVQVQYMPENASTISKLPGNLLRITGEFDVKLADYSIERPQMVLLKVGEVAHVTLDLFATDANQDKMTMWMEKMKKMMAGQ